VGFWRCFWYLIITGVIAFFAGRLIPKNWFRPDLFPYRSYKFEQDGRIYDKLKVRKWQNKIPDMSKILPKVMPPKNLSGNFRERMPRMLQETCVEEMIHSVLCVTGLRCLKLYPGIGGVIIVILYIVAFNLPFIIICIILIFIIHLLMREFVPGNILMNIFSHTSMTVFFLVRLITMIGL